MTHQCDELMEIRLPVDFRSQPDCCVRPNYTTAPTVTVSAEPNLDRQGQCVAKWYKWPVVSGTLGNDKWSSHQLYTLCSVHEHSLDEKPCC